MSEYLLPTERDAPADAEALSHVLGVRAGLVRQLGTGLWTWMPAGWRGHQRAVQIVREEMDAIGGLELLMPVIHPRELWKRTGRDQIDELFKLEDRKGSELVLAMTHEEAVTFHMSQIVRSYRDLPRILYHFQTKGRDEPRPRAGVLRTREFIMKDAYSFDRDEAGLDVSYEKHRGAYAKIFDRCGLEWFECASDVGMMGGTAAHEYMAPCPAGENDVVLAPGYAANIEVAAADADAFFLFAEQVNHIIGDIQEMVVQREREFAINAHAGGFADDVIFVADHRDERIVVERAAHQHFPLRLRKRVRQFAGRATRFGTDH